MFRFMMLLVAMFSIGCQSNSQPPKEQIDVVSIRSELMQIARAEQRYLLMYSKYGTLEELQKEQLLVDAPDRRGYTFAVSINGTEGFTVTASPADPAKTTWPTLSIDQTLQVSEKGRPE
jgi:hypothetical protein